MPLVHTYLLALIPPSLDPLSSLPPLTLTLSFLPASPPSSSLSHSGTPLAPFSTLGYCAHRSKSSTLSYGLLRKALTSCTKTPAFLLPKNSANMSSAAPLALLRSTLLSMAMAYSSTNSALSARKVNMESSRRMKARARDCRCVEARKVVGVKFVWLLSRLAPTWLERRA